MSAGNGGEAVPGTTLLGVVAVMDRLLSPGGCPWDREQTHESLTRYLVEETYEVLDAVDALTALGGPPSGAGPSDGADPDAPLVRAAEAELAEELGDVLLQVLFHARLAQARGAFDIDDVATGLADKLVRRHPHVFADEEHATGTAVQARWDELKAAEKPSRGVLDGIPAHLPALARADKVLARLARAGAPVPQATVPDVAGRDVAGPDVAGRDVAGRDVAGRDVAGPDVAGPDRAVPHGGTAVSDPVTPESVGQALFDLVRAAHVAGVDPEHALRNHLRRVEALATTSAVDAD